MLQGEHFAILSAFIKLPVAIKIFNLSIFEWPLKTGFTVVIREVSKFLSSIIFQKTFLCGGNCKRLNNIICEYPLVSITLKRLSWRNMKHETFLGENSVMCKFGNLRKPMSC